MFSRLLPASVSMLICAPGFAENLTVPGLSPNALTLDLPECLNTQDSNNCTRVLACIGTDGLYLDGQARGWNRGTIAAQRSDGVVCGGTWEAGTGPWGSGSAVFRCEDGVHGQVAYVSQDSSTGTAIARGMDNEGRHVKAWSGKNVLKFLGDGNELKAELPCSTTPIPIS